MNIKTVLVTYKQIIDGHYDVGNDYYDIASYVLTPSRIAAGINCPFNFSDDNCAFFFINVDGVVAARAQFFGTQFYADGEILPSGSGSSLKTAEQYRNQAVGAEVMLFAAMNKEYTTFIASGISDMALPLYRKLRYHILKFPRIMQLRNVRSVLESKGLNGFFLRATSTFVNFLLRIFLVFSEYEGRKLLKRFQVEKVETVPDWVDNMVFHEGHKYMEAHDHRWFQWNLDFNFRGSPQNIQSFFIVKESGFPIGFFMTKERYREKAGGTLRNVFIGSIVEWGVAADSSLSEVDMYKMALTTFTSKVDIVETATANLSTVKKMRLYGFIPYGYAHIALKDKLKKYKDASDINLWRIRYGYADVILT